MTRDEAAGHHPYDPTVRGLHPVGVRTQRLDSRRPGRGDLTAEIWYPATSAWAGLDLDEECCDRFVITPAIGPRLQHAVRDAEPLDTHAPLLLFSHHAFGSRRESSHLMTHLASHGYLVAAVDHSGNTVADAPQRNPPGTGRQDILRRIRDVTETRSQDLLELMDRLLEPRHRTVGVLGHSWGGYTALDVTARDRRVECVCAMTPGGAATHLITDCLREWLAVDWQRPVPTLIFASEHDSSIPRDGVVALYHRLHGPRRLCVLDNCDHAHYVDHVAAEHETMGRILESMPANTPDIRRTLELMRPIESLRDPPQALAAVRSVTLAHVDAAMRSITAAAGWLHDNAPALAAVQEMQCARPRAVDRLPQNAHARHRRPGGLT